jgi:hypothetical protein
MYPFSIWLGIGDVTPKVHGICESALWRQMNGVDSWSDLRITTASFCVNEDKAATGEYISVNGIQLYGDSSYYTSEIIPFWGYHVWSFGGGELPTLYDSVQATREFTITSPRFLEDTVSKKGFTVNYDLTGSDSIMIYFVYDVVRSREYDPTITDSNLVITDPVIVKSTGATAITSSMLSTNPFSPAFPERGITKMYIIAHRKKFVVVGGKQYLLRVGERCETSFFFRK